MSGGSRFRRRQTAFGMVAFHEDQCRSSIKWLAHNQCKTGSFVSVKASVNVPGVSHSSKVILTGVPAAANRSGCHAFLVFQGTRLADQNSSFILQFVPWLA